MSARAAAVVMLAAVVAVVATRRAGAVVELLPAPLAGSLSDLAGVVDDAVYDFSGYRVMSGWLEAADKPENSALVAAMHAAEARYAIPRNLVVRLAWQESRFKVDAHNAASNASGIMQIVPYWHPGVDVWNPLASIDYGARYLRDLYRQFGTWELALKAYNWGPGNVAKWIAGGEGAPVEPLETRLYSSQILGDLAAAGMGVVA